MNVKTDVKHILQVLLPNRTKALLPLSLTVLTLSFASPAQAQELEITQGNALKLSFSKFSPSLRARAECSEEDDECEEEEPECEEGEECEEEEPECEEGEECEGEEPECEEGEECEDEEPECEEGEECEGEEPECEEGEECEDEEPECEDGEECEDEEPECEEDEECETDDNFVTTGYNNPNPIADTRIENVTTEQANRASRFLHQATLGADYPTITQVANTGEAQWLEQQFEQPIGYIFPYTHYLLEQQEQFAEEQEPHGSPVWFYTHGWWTQVMTSPDLVRQRVALALSEIFVVSANVEVIGESPYAITGYYDTLLKHSFGNYRELLLDISLNPAMAVYLSHLNNEKADPNKGTFPDENYAREVMQLFSIGLFELNPDGTRKKDAEGNDIATYGQSQIREFAKIFTGLSIESEDEEGFGIGLCCNEQFYLHSADLKPLRMWDEFHSQGEKHLLNGTVVPAGQTGMQDIEAAIDNLFNHPNVGPFIGKQLIQRLVKSNPSPAYVARVTAAFNGDDNTPRGDMKAVIRAVLLDPEAREVNANTFAEGRLREPFLRLLRLARSFNATTADRTFATEGFDIREKIQQTVFYAPSVFNFFQPSYSPNGDVRDANLVAPEFQITNAVTIVEIKNLIQTWLITGRFEQRVGQLQAETVDFTYEVSLASNPEQLLQHLNTVMTYGTLSQHSQDVIRQVIENEPRALARVKKAIYLIATSPDYAVSL